MTTTVQAEATVEVEVIQTKMDIVMVDVTNAAVAEATHVTETGEGCVLFCFFAFLF